MGFLVSFAKLTSLVRDEIDFETELHNFDSKHLFNFYEMSKVYSDYKIYE